MKIRKARKEDFEELVRLMHEYDKYEHNLDKRLKLDTIPEVRKDLRQRLKDKSTIFIVVEDKGRVVGFVCYIIDKRGRVKIGILQDIYIDEGYRGKGIGKKLVEIVLNIMKNSECILVKSAVREKNIKSQEFWEKMRFKIDYNPCAFSMQKVLK